jgi:hypothetical protein
LKRIFAEIATTITLMLILTSVAFIAIPAANSATGDTEADWQLTVTGLIENSLTLNWTEIKALPKTTVNADLFCVDYPSTPLQQGNWTGIKLKTLLEEAKPLAAAFKIGFFASDDFSTDLSVEIANRDDIILAYEKDGVFLNDIRLVVPGHWGYKWISQLISIKLVDYDFHGFWESRGYSDEASFTGPTSAGTSDFNLPISPRPSSNPPTPSPSIAPSPAPTASPTPAQSKLPPVTSEKSSIPMGAVFVIAAWVLAAALVAVLTFVRKRRKLKSAKPEAFTFSLFIQTICPRRLKRAKILRHYLSFLSPNIPV